MELFYKIIGFSITAIFFIIGTNLILDEIGYDQRDYIMIIGGVVIILMGVFMLLVTHLEIIV